jgi:hypothetical protein
MAAKYVLECIEKEAQFEVKVKSTNDMPVKTQREAGGVDVTIRKPAEGSGWSAPRCGHFNPGKDRVSMAQKTQFKVLPSKFSQLC